MIFLTVGTTQFPFHRFIRAVDNVLLSTNRNEKLIAQVGRCTYRISYKNKKVCIDASYDELIQYMKRARVVLGHGGFGTALLGIRYSRNKIFVVPRSKGLGEHVDDHQIYLSQYLEEKKLIKMALPSDDLEGLLSSYVASPQRNLPQNLFVTRTRLINNLTQYTEAIGQL